VLAATADSGNLQRPLEEISDAIELPPNGMSWKRSCTSKSAGFD
jgi:hypothetical protein